MVLPSTRDMAADCAAQAAWKRRVMPPQLHRSAALLLYMQAYHDQLVMDMGHMPVVKVRAQGKGRRVRMQRVLDSMWCTHNSLAPWRTMSRHTQALHSTA